MSTEELAEKRTELLSVIRAREIELLRMRWKRRSGLPLLLEVVAIGGPHMLESIGEREDFDQ